MAEDSDQEKTEEPAGKDLAKNNSPETIVPTLCVTAVGAGHARDGR